MTCSTSSRPRLEAEEPSPQTFDHFLARRGVDTCKGRKIYDLARDLRGTHALGMTTVLVVPEGGARSIRER